MKHDPARHSRRSIRLPEYDYNQPGAYFVTICTHGHKCLLGDVINNAVQLSSYGQLAATYWTWLAEQYVYVQLDQWIIMPNHLHGVIIVDDVQWCRGGSRTAPTKHKPLGRLIGAFKTVSTKRINRTRPASGTRFWQRNYYEHVVRNENELDRIRQYIIDNPLQWALDRENPKAVRPSGKSGIQLVDEIDGLMYSTRANAPAKTE